MRTKRGYGILVAMATEAEVGLSRGMRRLGYVAGWLFLLTVLCWGQGGQAPEWFYWFVEPPGSPLVLPIGQPIKILVGDFDEDGNPDLVLAAYRGPFIWELGPDYGMAEINIVMLRGDGRGGFKPFTTILTTKGSFVAQGVIDMNKDGHHDLVVLRRHITHQYFKTEIQTMFGNGTGELAPPVTLFEIDDIPRHVAIADVNGDSHLDFVVAHRIVEVVSVFLADGRGGFTHYGSIQLDTDPAQLPHRVVVADCNNDGHMDVAISGEVYEAHDQRTRFVMVFLGDGTGGFPRRSFLMTFGPPENEPPWINLIALDWDRDGNLDLITSRADQILLLLGNGDGTLTLDEQFWFPVSDIDHLLAAVTDFNQDGCWDWVILYSPRWGDLDLIVDNCGEFAGGRFGLAGRRYVSSAVVADLDQDGDLDVVYVIGVMDRQGNEVTHLEWVLNNTKKGGGGE